MWTRFTSENENKSVIGWETPEEREKRRSRQSREKDRRLHESGVGGVSCTGWSFVKWNGFNASVIPVYCKKWTCKRCGPKRQKAVKYLGRAGKPNKFLTLTAGPRSGETESEKARSLVHALRTLRRKAKKEFEGKNVQFLAVFEKTELGAPHLHILLRCKYIPQKWISRMMKDLIDSPIVDIRRIRSRRMAVAYCAKYIAKDPIRFEGCKRYWRSLNWKEKSSPVEKEKGPYSSIFYIVRKSPEIIKNGLKRIGYTMTLIEDTYFGQWWNSDPPPYCPGKMD